MSNSSNDHVATFLAALQALQSHSTSPDERKRANDWLTAFQRNAASWNVAKQLLLDPSVSADVQLFAAQTLKSRARLCRSAPTEQCQQLQHDVLGVLTQLPNASLQLTKQLCLALVDMSLPHADSLGQLISHVTSTLPSSSAFLALEYLAEEVSSLTHFGSGGSNEERVEALAELKSKLRMCAGGVFAWLSHQSQQPTSSSKHAASILTCFNAWTRVGSLHDVPKHDDLQALLTLALTHLRQPESEAFEASADALAEVIDHCPEAWLSALQEPMVSLVEVAVAAADSGRVSASEHICRVVAPYAAMRINVQSPGSGAGKTMFGCLTRLAALSHISDEGDPACWPALQAWIGLAEGVLGISDDGCHDGQDEGGPGPSGGDGQFRSAAQVAAQQGHAAGQAHVPEEFRSTLDQLFVTILHNMVAWQQPTEDSPTAAAMDAFTPTFMAVLIDFLAATCDIIGPNRYASLLCMMMEHQQGTSAVATRVAAAAMHAVSAAGGRRLSSDPGSQQMLAALMHKAASMGAEKQQQQQQQQHANGSSSSGRAQAGLVPFMPFCCAAAATARGVVVYMCRHGKGQEAQQFLSSTLETALQGLSCPGDRDSQDLQTPAALAIKSLMQGAREAGLAVPIPCIYSLVGAVQRNLKLGPLAESNLISALSLAVLTVEEAGGKRQQVQLESLQQLLQPLHAILNQAAQQQQQALPSGTEEQLRGHLRSLELLLENSLLAPEDEDGAQQNGHGPQGSQDHGVFTWLTDTMLNELWPKLAQLLSKGSLSGPFLTPLCKSLALLMRAAPGRCESSLPSIMEAMISCMFRPGGSVVHETLSVALEVYGSSGSHCLELLQQVVQHVLGEPRVGCLGALGAADEQPELAECCAKVLGSYSRHLLLPVSSASSDAAKSAVSSIARVAAACTCCHHRGVAAAALTCTSDLVGAAVAAVRALEAGQQQQQQQQQQAQQQAEVLARSVMQNGDIICMGVIGGLLSSFPLSKLHKASTVLAELASLTMTSYGQDLAQQQQAGQQPGAQAQLQLLAGWLAAGARGCQIAEGEQQSLLQQWPPAVLEAASGLRASAREQGIASRKLKKLLREFADMHARDN